MIMTYESKVYNSQIFRGKRIRPDDPNWDAGRWYIYKRCSGTTIHRALKGVFSEKEALETEMQIVRRIARQSDKKFADRVAAKVVRLPTAKPINGHLYIIESGGYYKIGQTTRLASRLKQLTKTIIPYDTRVLLAVEIRDGAHECERHLHNMYADYRIEGEWFDLTLTQLAELMREVIEYALIP